MTREWRSNGYDERPSVSNVVAAGDGPPGKRTLTESLLNPYVGAPSTGQRTLDKQTRTELLVVQRTPAHPAAARAGGTGNTGHKPRIAPPRAGIDKTGFIDSSKGAPIYDRPAEIGGELVRPVPLPPATRVFVSGTDPRLTHWWHITAYLEHTMVRGYVQDFRINIDLPEPLAELRQLVGGETAEGLAREKFGGAVTDGHDLRYYENVLLHVNQERHRAGIISKYQDPGILGGGSNNIQLIAGHRIWLVSAGYAKALQGVVPSGSLTGGAVAKVKRFAGHLQDIVASVTESPRHCGEVVGAFAQAIRDHMAEIIGITAGFIMAEATSMFLAAAPTGVSQAAAAVIQLTLSAFGAASMVQASVEALQHGTKWLLTSWSARGDVEKITAASKEFLRMLVAIAMAALGYLGVKGNYGNALEIASKMPTDGLPALATAGSAAAGEAHTAAGVSIRPSTAAIGAAGAQMTKRGGAAGGSEPPKRTDAKIDSAKPAESNTREAPGPAPAPGTSGRKIPWSSKALREAERALDEGAISVTVGSKAEAEELFLFRYANEGGYLNTTGLTPKGTRVALGSKRGTYHWDIGPKNHPHGMDHLQVHTYDGDVIRIYFHD